MINTQIIYKVKDSIIGKDTKIPTPFGNRLLTYADYTASGRCLTFIENYLQKCMETYGNTHTEDDATGAISTEKLHLAEKIIKRSVNAGANYAIIETGSGATGAIHHLQQLLGVYVAPAGKELFNECFSPIVENKPVVFIGSYEHHSNEISWRECFAEVVVISLDENGFFDLEDLEKKVSKKEYSNRMKIGSFSAASNVTGLKSPVYDIAKILHKYDALAFFDYAAGAPYLEINMERDEESYFDGIFFSPHKFIGGPGGSGILIIKRDIYNNEAPPTIAGGGTVDFVNAYTHEYSKDIEVREKAGTPGILQVYKSALAIELKNKIGMEFIETREKDIIGIVKKEFSNSSKIVPVALFDEENNLPIVSLNIKNGKSWLHPRYIVKLMNDLFGIQTRAGCSCAGPYGHTLLGIGEDISLRYKKAIDKGDMGLKPGWVRVSFHYLMDNDEILFICDALRIVAEHGELFLSLYDFDIKSGAWKNRTSEDDPVFFSIDEALRTDLCLKEENSEITSVHTLRSEYMEYAIHLAGELGDNHDENIIKSTQPDLKTFSYISLSD